MGDKEEKYTVCVPYTEEVKSTRKVTKCVPETTTKKVKVCGGHWETQTKEVTGGCDDCCKRTVCCRVWVPEENEKEVSCTTYKSVTEEVPCTHTVCKTRQEERTRQVQGLPHGEGRADLQSERLQDPPRRADLRQGLQMVPETDLQGNVCKYRRRADLPVQGLQDGSGRADLQSQRLQDRQEERTCKVNVCKTREEKKTREYKVCKMESEEKTREVKYTVCKPEERTRKYTVCHMECKPEKKTVTYNVCVPHMVKKEIEVKVCHMVQKQVEVPCSNCGGCNSGCSSCGCGK